MTLLQLENVCKTFRRRGTSEHTVALDNVSLSVAAGESVALVGESGSGKSTLARVALSLEQPDSGSVKLADVELTTASRARIRELRRVIQPIFQDATASFNPRRAVGSAMGQALRHSDVDQQRKREEAAQLLDNVGLRPGAEYLGRMPHELSGGQRQRLSIARALAMNPQLVIADEPLSGADVSVRGQVMNLLTDIQADRGLAYLMITHDISLARAFADRVAVMYAGRIVEHGDASDVLDNPQHEYTQRLIGAVPQFESAEPRPQFEGSEPWQPTGSPAGPHTTQEDSR